MDYYKLNAMSSAVMAFATVLGVMFALIYYLKIIVNINILEISLLGIVYIDVILSFLYYLKRISRR